ncbi:hypothetical protein F2S72_08680 [Pseudomonas syringae pv. actinidiae]|nr:hypothetical protein [Pseudomonas syringae pv. actinidiae]
MANKPMQITCPPAARTSASDPKLYSFGQIPSMDDADEDYTLILTVRAADSDQERLIADTCTRAISSTPQAVAAMQAAYAKLDSVAFVSEEGDTDDLKSALLAAIAALTPA